VLHTDMILTFFPLRVDFFTAKIFHNFDGCITRPSAVARTDSNNSRRNVSTLRFPKLFKLLCLKSTVAPKTPKSYHFI